MKRNWLLLLVFGLTMIVGCGGGGGGGSQAKVSTLAFSWNNGVESGSRTVNSSTFRAINGATITFDRMIDGDGGAFVLSNPANVPNTQTVVQGFPVPLLRLYIDGITYTASDGATVTVTNAVGNVSGTFQGNFQAAGQSSKQISGTFTVYYDSGGGIL